MREYWRGIKICDIKHITKGGYNGLNEPYSYFQVVMNNGDKNTLYFDGWKAKDHRKELVQLFNKINNIPETYLLENEIDIKVDGVLISFGCRVENNLGTYEYKTLIEIEELRKQGRIRDEGWRHLLYICLLEISNGKIVKGKVTEQFKKQLDVMGIMINE